MVVAVWLFSDTKLALLCSVYVKPNNTLVDMHTSHVHRRLLELQGLFGIPDCE